MAPRRPVVAPLANDFYEALGPLPNGDADRDWPLLRYCDVLVAGGLAQVDAYVGEREGQLGWAGVLDPYSCPPEGLPYLAQFCGVTLEPSLTVQEQRDKIALPENFQRGTPQAMIAAAKRTLIGQRAVSLVERPYGEPYQVWVRTRTAQTPSPARTRAALLTQKPMGILLDYDEINTWAWLDLVAAEASWSEVVSGYATWMDVASVPPPVTP